MIRVEQRQTLKLYVLSGGTGRTAKDVVAAGLAQFDDPNVEVIAKSGIRTVSGALKVVEEAHRDEAIVCHTFVAPDVRAAVVARLQELNMPYVDVLGPILAVLADHLAAPPRGKAGLLYQAHREQFDRMDAMDYTLTHDDGNRLRDLSAADVVIVGASRVTKSVTCFCLAARGIRAANVPLIPQAKLPRELTKLDKRRVIGFTMNASHLAAVRSARIARITSKSVPAYASVAEIARELSEVREIMRMHHWQILDVSYLATEEVVSQVLGMIPRRRRR
jgi:regulator of PEP synthase PpsR (kinase-PPPase family)